MRHLFYFFFEIKNDFVFNERFVFGKKIKCYTKEHNGDKVIRLLMRRIGRGSHHAISRK